MKLGFKLPPAPMKGADQLARWFRDNKISALTLLADPAIVDQPIMSAVWAQAANAGITPRLVTGSGCADIESVRALADSLVEGEFVVGVGGGTVLDTAKLAALAARSPEALRRITAPQRSGMVTLPSPLGDSTCVVAVPTTLGTGSELSTVACFESAGVKRLVTGLCLRPAAAVWDARATATLPVEQVADGVLEALFRTVSAYVGDPTNLPEQDALVEELAGRLIQLGNAVADCRQVGEPVDAELRLQIAEDSAESQIGLINMGRDPYSVKGWAVANELSMALGLPKMRAVAAIWPVLWRRIGVGDTRLGDSGRMHQLWTGISHRAPWLSADPAAGIAELMDGWGIERRVQAPAASLDRIVTRTMRAWGAGLPMLGGLTAADLRALLAEATQPPADPPEAASSQDHHVTELHSLA